MQKLRAENIQEIYNKLLDAFGPQGWWPLTEKTKPVHSGKSPNSERERFEIIIGAILTQNTSWKNVEKAIENLNREGMIAIERIRKCEHKELAELIKPAGYYNQKAKRIKDFVDFLERNYGGKLSKLFSLDTAELRRELLNLKGIGKETADSIILYAAEKPVFVIDAYTRRIMKRIGFEEKSYEELQNLFMKNLPKDVQLFKEYHALLVNLGKNYCLKRKPRCMDCVLREICKFSLKKSIRFMNINC